MCNHCIYTSSGRGYYNGAQVPKTRATAFERRADAVFADLAASALFALIVAVFVRALS